MDDRVPVDFFDTPWPSAHNLILYQPGPTPSDLPRYRCGLCCYHTKRRIDVLHHVLGAHPEVRAQALECSAMTAKRTRSRAYACPACPSSFAHKRSLEAHVKRLHPTGPREDIMSSFALYGLCSQ